MNSSFITKSKISLLVLTWLITGCIASKNSADGYFKSGNIKSYQGDYKGAIRDFGRALKINPSHAKAYLGRSNVKYNLKNYKGAIEDCNTAIRINPNLVDAYFNLGISYYELKKYKNAIQELNRSITQRPKDPEAYYIRGKAKMHMGDTLGACGDWQQASEMKYVRATNMQNKYCKHTNTKPKIEEDAPAQVREIKDN